MDGLAAYIAAVLSDLGWAWPFLLAVGIFLSSLVGSWVIHVLKDDKSFEDIRGWVLKPGLGARYTDLITIGLNVAARFYGPKPGLSLQGYFACLVIALAYLFLLLQLAWVLDGPATIAGSSVFDDTAQTYQRWLSLSAIWILLIFTFILVRQLDHLIRFIDRLQVRLVRRVGLIGGKSESMPRADFAEAAVTSGVGGVVAVAGVVVVAVVAIVVGGAGVVAVAGLAGGAFGAVAAVVAVAAGGAGGAIGAFFTAAVVVVVVAIVVGVEGGAFGAVGAVLFLTLFLFVPAANAVLDHISVQVSRWLLNDLVNRRGTARQNLMMLGHVFADVVAAAIFLVLLAVLLPSVLQHANRAFDAAGWPVVEWGPYLDAARREPFGAGLLVTGMLATTLIPTILHMLAAGGALVLPIIGGNLIEDLATKPEPTLLDRVRLIVLTVFSVLLSWAVLAIVAIAIWEAAAAFGLPLGSNLADLAETIGRAIGGPGAPP
jgi:hypothetical protein